MIMDVAALSDRSVPMNEAKAAIGYVYVYFSVKIHYLL